MNESSNLKEHIKRLSLAAYRASTPGAEEAVPRAGDLLHLDTCTEPGVEWLVLAIEADQCVLVPADTVPFVGSRDHPVADEKALGPLRLRGGVICRVARAALPRRRSGFVSTGDLERIRARAVWPEVPLGNEPEMDYDPDYRDWYRALERACRAVARGA